MRQMYSHDGGDESLPSTRRLAKEAEFQLKWCGTIAEAGPRGSTLCITVQNHREEHGGCMHTKELWLKTMNSKKQKGQEMTRGQREDENQEIMFELARHDLILVYNPDYVPDLH